MSGGAGKSKKAARQQGWEEAGAEFYQESYPHTDVDFDALQQNPKHLATLLPSKQTRAAATIRLRNAGGTISAAQQTMRNTMRHRGNTGQRSYRRESTFNNRRASVAADVQVAMMPDLSQNLSNEQTTWEEIMEIKAMPVSMGAKKEMKARLQNEPNLRLQGYEQFRYKRRKFWDHLKVSVRETYNKLELWRSTLKVIEGNFGTGVVAYFLFIKWLLYLNIVICALIFGFVILPTLLLETENSKELCPNSTDFSTECCSAIYYNNSVDSLLILDFFQGTGFMERTHLFYGYYVAEIRPYFSGTVEMYYNIPLAYILIAATYFLISLVAIVRAASHGFRERLVEGEGQFYQYCNLIFGGWDFCTDNERSAAKKHEALYREIRDCLHAERAEEERKNRTRSEKNKIYLIRTLVNFAVVLILAACATGIYFAFSFSTDKSKERQENEQNGVTTSSDDVLNLLHEFLPSITIVLFNLSVPILFRTLVNFEQYSPVFVVRIQLVRTVFLRLSSLVVLLASLYSKVNCMPNDGCFSSECNTPVCWETFVGQQFYKLAITDFITHLVMTFLINFPRSRIAHLDNKFAKLVGEQVFDLPKHVLDIVYLQTVTWIGAFYAPLLPLMSVLICFVMFYIKKFTCLVNSVPSPTVYRASRSNSLFMLVLLVSYIFSIIPVAFSIGEIFPSKSCGPFRGKETVWKVVVDAFISTPDWLQSIVFFLSTAGFAIPAFVVLMLSLYYYTAVTSANRHMVVVLRNQLVLEGHDKQFLLDKLSLFIKQQQKRMRHTEQLSQQQDGDRNIASN